MIDLVRNNTGIRHRSCCLIFEFTVKYNWSFLLSTRRRGIPWIDLICSRRDRGFCLFNLWRQRGRLLAHRFWRPQSPTCGNCCKNRSAQENPASDVHRKTDCNKPLPEVLNRNCRCSLGAVTEERPPWNQRHRQLASPAGP